MYFKSSTFFIFISLFAASAASLFGVLAVPQTFAATYKCDTPEEKAVCQQQLNATEAEIAQLGTQLAGVQVQGASLAKDKQILDLQIKQAALQIKAHELSIANIGKDIAAKSANIKTLQGQIDAGKQSLGQILRQTNQIDDISLPEIFLGNQNLSDSFADLDSFDTLKNAMAEKFAELTDAQHANQNAQVALGKQKDKEVDTKAGIEAEKKKVQVAEAEKQRLLNLNKTEQNSYQQTIAQKAAQAAQIRSALFKLAGSAAIPFGTALEYAKTVQAKTTVDPAFLLAIMTQESNLGANVGSCYLTNTDTGAGVKASTGAAVTGVMKPSRDVAPFLEITKSLGLDYTQTRVSCPLSIGYGGAMGPAQFIPSTWKLFIPRLQADLGVSTPNPWAPLDAFMASGLYLADLGGTNGSKSGEIRAACKYYGSGGATCAYGTQVLAKVAAIQANIDILNGN